MGEALHIHRMPQDFQVVAELRDTVGVHEVLAWRRFDDTVIAVAVDRLPNAVLLPKDQCGANQQFGRL